jgi:hypothetical protein
MALANTLAYYDTAAITALKSFNAPAPNDSVSWHSKVVEYKNIVMGQCISDTYSGTRLS